MIRGKVNARREAVLRISLRDSSGQPVEIEAVLDTGFTGSLTLPAAVIEKLGLPWRTRGSALLANGDRDHFDIHAATILWDGKPRKILVEAAETVPLVGMALLKDHDVWFRVVDGGEIKIRKTSETTAT